MKTTSPVDSNVAVVQIEPSGTFEGTTSGNRAVFKEPIKYRTIVTDVDSSLTMYSQ